MGRTLKSKSTKWGPRPNGIPCGIGYSLAELHHEEALVEVRAAVGAADEVLVLVALVLAPGTLWLRAMLEVLRLDVWMGRVEEQAQKKSKNWGEPLPHKPTFC